MKTFSWLLTRCFGWVLTVRNVEELLKDVCCSVHASESINLQRGKSKTNNVTYERQHYLESMMFQVQNLCSGEEYMRQQHWRSMQLKETLQLHHQASGCMSKECVQRHLMV